MDDYLDDITPAVLRNRGVPIVMAVVTRKPVTPPEGLTEQQLATIELPLGPSQLVYDDAGEPLTVIEHLRFDMNAIAAVEEQYATLANWQLALAETPAQALRTTIAIVLGRDLQEVGQAMLTDHQGEYAIAVGAAWAIANGLDPTETMKVLRMARDAIAEGAATTAVQLSETIEAVIAEGASPGATGLEPGVE